MRRTASNTGRQCRRPPTRCRTHRRTPRTSGMNALAAPLEQRRHRRLREQSTSSPGRRRRNSCAIARSRRACPSPSARRRTACAAAGPRPPPGRRLRRRQQKLAQQQVDAHRVARVGRMAAALESNQPAARLRRQLDPFGMRARAIVVAVDHQHGATHASGRLTRVRLAELGESTSLAKLSCRARRPLRPELICRVE